MTSRLAQAKARPATALVRPVFQPLPLGSVRPSGWLLQQLQLQASGLSGHLDQTWDDVGPNSGWLGGTGESWERGPYWMDGLVPLAFLLDDALLKAKLQPWMEWTLHSQTLDGNFGPQHKNNDWWPRMVMLKALTQYQEASGDARVVPFLERYFAYQQKTLPGQPLQSWAKYRWQDNVLTVFWLYDRNQDPQLLTLARLLHDQGHDWASEFEHFTYTAKTSKSSLEQAKKTGGYHETHGVDVAMGLKSAAVWSRLSGIAADRDATPAMLAVLDRYHGLPNGMYSADEHLAGLKPYQGTELCTVVEAMYSLEQALAVSGNHLLADRLETIAFNALPGAISDDMWSHQYDQQPNQIECSLQKRPWTNNGPESNLFGLEPNFGCCCANFNQGWPKLAASLWMRSEDGGLVATVYAPSIVNTSVNGVPVRLETVTEYPFRNHVEVRLTPQAATRFALRLRVPSWTTARVSVNGRLVAAEEKPGFVTLRRDWAPGDTVRIEFVLEPRILAGFDNSVSVRRGPLVFALPVEAKWNKLRDRGLTADWEVLPQSAWNYGLPAAATGSIVTHEQPVGAVPFSIASPPVTLEVSAQPVGNWLEREGCAGDFPAMPDTPSAVCRVKLVPYAAAKLRITAFPKLS
jgi:hypothetical protein